MNKICVVTGSRAEFGLLLPVIKRIQKSSLLDLNLVVTGSHLSEIFGNTYLDIEKEGIPIDEKIRLNLTGDSKFDMAQSTGDGIKLFSNYFLRKRPDLLLVLGDRYEIFSCCVAASMMNIPIAHIAGGETTEGAIDEFVRHSITKMSYLHFVATEVYKKRVIQLGESPERVFNVGALGVENTLKLEKVSLNNLCNGLGIDLKQPYCVVTFHPETLGNIEVSLEITELLESLKLFSNYGFVFLKANSDAGGRLINDAILEECKMHSNWYFFDSLDSKIFLSLLSYATAMIGNSSCGITEAPFLKVPTVNVGDRQKGRLKPSSVFDCPCNKEAIYNTILKAVNYVFNEKDNLFGCGNTSKLIVGVLEEWFKNDRKFERKSFFDLNVSDNI